MNTIRFYIRWEDGRVTDDETCIIETADVSKVEKGFGVLLDDGTIVIEFDPPLKVAS